MSGNYQIALGDYRFTLEYSAYQELQRRTQYRWAKQDVIQSKPSYQAVGFGEDSISLSGIVFNYRQNLSAKRHDYIQAIRDEASQQKPLRLALESGVNMGYWVINSINEVQSNLLVNAPLKQSFDIELSYYGESIT